MEDIKRKNISLAIPLGTTVYLFHENPEDEIIIKTKINSVMLAYFEETDSIEKLYYTMAKTIIHSKKSGYVVGNTLPASTLHNYILGQNLFLSKDEIKLMLKEIRNRKKKRN